MLTIELEKLKGLIHPLNDTIQMCIDVVEVYTKKLEPGARFEVLNACRALKRIQRLTLRSAAALVESIEHLNNERAASASKEKRLLLLQCKADALTGMAEILGRQRQAINDQVAREVGRPLMSRRKKKRRPR